MKKKKLRKPKALDYAWITGPDSNWIYVASNVSYIDVDTAEYLASWLFEAAGWIKQETESKLKKAKGKK